ncbi:MAG: aldo/keto reductase, partial [Proteobacteria bacterium]|nr:aldo/keto reductase [Pseudomonadota bacterium]
FESLKRDGKILSWGVSNFDVDDLEEVTALNGPPACNQVLYHLGERAIEHAVIPWCAAHGTAVVAYTPLGKSAAMYEGHGAGARALQQVAARHGATPRQVALRFLLRDDHVFAIPKASRTAHVAENAAAAALELGAADLAAIDAAFKRGAVPRSLPTS